jgi:hypothetical protein
MEEDTSSSVNLISVFLFLNKFNKVHRNAFLHHQYISLPSYHLDLEAGSTVFMHVYVTPLIKVVECGEENENRAPENNFRRHFKTLDGCLSL